MTFHFHPSRIRSDWRPLAIFWHWLLRDRERKSEHRASVVRHVEGERSDDWMDRTG